MVPSWFTADRDNRVSDVTTIWRYTNVYIIIIIIIIIIKSSLSNLVLVRGTCSLGW